ncbi:MAG: peptidoglycan-associated lipoprotein, partial [Nitrospiraceae bacterium]
LHEIERRKGEEAAAAAGLKDIFFGFDSWTISDEAKQSLLHDAAWLRRNSDKSLVIEGHRDERGTLAYNLAL